MVEGMNRGVLSPLDRRRPRVRWTLRGANGLLLLVLVIVGLGPLLWLAKSAISTTQDTLRYPMRLWPSGFDFENLVTAWRDAQIDRYFMNTVKIAVGSWIVQLIVAVTGGFVLGVLRPWYARILTPLVLVTLLVPPIVLLVPLFLTVLDLPIVGTSLLNSYWGIWLPAGASAFNVILVKRFMENLPGEIIEAARVDGAGPFRLLWSIVLPLSKPVVGVVSVFSVLVTWKDYLWPLVVLPDPAIQPLSVRLPLVRDTLQLDVFLASLAISTVLPITLFIVFRRFFLSGEAMGGALKG
jgi:multiple sugar transport system permease protein